MAPGDVTYKATGATRIKICGRFRVASKEQASGYVSSGASAYPQLEGPRLAGLHCFDLDLIKLGELANIERDKRPATTIP
jgi:hypothetical protein